MPTDYQPKITDVDAKSVELYGHPNRLKADGEQMMLEIVALEVLVDVLISYPNVREMARNAHGRLYPERSVDYWEDYFESVVPAMDRDETIRQLREELRAAEEDVSHDPA